MTKEQVTHITNHIAEDTSESISRKKLVMSTNRPPSCDLPPEFYKSKLKPCPFCGAKAEQYNFDSLAFCTRQGCKVVGPDNDPHGHKWNSIPRRSEVLELIRLVDEVTGWENDLIDTNEFSEDGEAMINDIGNLREYANKLRQEMEA
jgi:hypothetical protein